MNFSKLHLLRPVLIASLTTFSVACDFNKPASSIKTTEVPQSSVKRQSIGNCWAYAVVGWAESLHLQATGETVDMSESYISYWASFYELTRDHELSKLQEGGSWELASYIIRKHGWILESEFIPEEEGLMESARQEKAVEYINEQLKPGGRLHGKENRTNANILTELNAAFGVDINAVTKNVRSAKDFVILGKNGRKIDLEDALDSFRFEWKSIVIPQEEGATEISEKTKQERLEIVRRVQRALNDRLPVVISFRVGFNALDPADGMFKVDRYTEAGEMGQQGGHMAILHDYVVDDVPGAGTIEEGDVSAELKEAALQGNVRYFKIKNSWGIDRPERGIVDGFNRLGLDYLFTNLPWEYGDKEILTSAWMDVVLPPGY